MKHQKGCVEVITGSMFCGKTDEMIRRLRRAEIAKQKVQVFKPAIDQRYDEEMVVSHAGTSFDAVPIEKASDIRDKLASDTTVVAIDEAQFLDKELIPLVNELASEDLRVIISGLDLDFRAEPFGPMPALISQAEHVDKLHAICMVCGEDASRSQRLINGQPAHYDDPVVIIGADEMYEARCRKCHVVPYD
ncbi:MAG: thymidine kinase [Anaerolineales bacterium]|jgi:thymidine kinase